MDLVPRTNKHQRLRIIMTLQENKLVVGVPRSSDEVKWVVELHDTEQNEKKTAEKVTCKRSYISGNS